MNTTTTQQQPSNTMQQPPPGYALVPISQLQSMSPGPSQDNQQQPPFTLPQLPAEPTPEFPTSKPLMFKVRHVDYEHDLFVPTSSLRSTTQYETQYRKMDYNRKSPHTVISRRLPSNELVFAGSAMYHHYWTNNLTMKFPWMEEWEFGEAFVSDVGTCEGRNLQFVTGDAKGGAFRLEVIETNKKLICRAHMDTMQEGQIEIWEPLITQQQMDEMVVVVGSFMQRYRIKLWTDGKFPIPWDKIDKVTKVSNAVLGVASGMPSASGT